MNIETTYFSGTLSAFKSTNIEGFVTLDQFVLRIQYMIQLLISKNSSCTLTHLGADATLNKATSLLRPLDSELNLA